MLSQCGLSLFSTNEHDDDDDDDDDEADMKTLLKQIHQQFSRVHLSNINNLHIAYQ